MMKRIMALTLAGALSASMATAAFASTRDSDTVDEDTTAGIAFEPGDPGIIDPPTTVDPEDPEIPIWPPLVVDPETPGLPDVSDFGSIGLEFGTHQIPLINTRYESMKAGDFSTTARPTENNSADMFILAYNTWDVTAKIAPFNLGTSTIDNFHLWLVPRTDVKNPVVALGEESDITLVAADAGNNGPFPAAGTTGAPISPSSGAKTVASGNAGLFGARFAGVLDIAKGSVALSGDASAELTWTLTQSKPTA